MTFKLVLLAMGGHYQPKRYPAQLIRPKRGRILWLLDKAAARLLPDYYPIGRS